MEIDNGNRATTISDELPRAPKYLSRNVQALQDPPTLANQHLILCRVFCEKSFILSHCAQLAFQFLDLAVSAEAFVEGLSWNKNKAFEGVFFFIPVCETKNYLKAKTQVKL